MGWGFQSQLVLSVQSQGWLLRIAMDAMPGQVGWAVFAVAAPTPVGEALTPESAKARMDELLAAHQHRNLGVFRTLSEAVAVAERYADGWQRRHKGGELCACDEIDSGPCDPADPFLSANGEHVDGTNGVRAHD